mmetsp:Transcript_8999/g.24940  ORF Transcript_8999/g.24940 Transcript_8999/m.24940 type:complete len:752 (+) Transcript_8999:140-2395(+)
MAAAPEKRRPHQFNDLEPLNILKHPVWIFDSSQKSMFFANTAALEIWDSDSLEALLSRDFASDMSEATEKRIDEMLVKLVGGETVQEQWTFYPKGKAVTVEMTHSVVYIDDGRPACLAEAELPNHRERIEESSTRDIEMLRHVPVPVARFDLQGKNLYQNPEDLRVFGMVGQKRPEVRTDGGGGEVPSDDNSFVNRFVDKELGRTVLEKAQKERGENDSSTDGSSTIRLDTDYRVDEAELLVDQGPPRHFAVTLRKSPDPYTSEPIILYSARDVTEIRQARLKSEFMSVIAHEIRTPLHQIAGFMDLLELSNRPETPLSHSQLESVKLVQKSTESLMDIINDLLDYNVLEAGHLKLSAVKFSVTSVLDACVAAVEAEAANKGLELICEFSEDLQQQEQHIGDPNKLRQIIINLLLNAVKFTHKGSVTFKAFVRDEDDRMQYSLSSTTPETVSQSTEETKDDGIKQIIRFEVIDTGIGIDECHREIIFERYGQANGSIQHEYGGTGLGLSICKSLTEAMGGKIGMESEVGNGTTFSLEIPLEPVSASPSNDSPQTNGVGSMNIGGVPKVVIAPSPAASRNNQYKSDAALNDPNNSDSSSGPHPTSLRILVAEDNAVSQKMIKRMLVTMGHSVTIACNGQEAVDALQKEQAGPSVVATYDLVLMDIQMPVLDGVEATKVIRSRLNIKQDELPVLGLTASFHKSDLGTYLRVGMNTCLSKPIRFDALKTALETFAVDDEKRQRQTMLESDETPG